MKALYILFALLLLAAPLGASAQFSPITPAPGVLPQGSAANSVDDIVGILCKVLGYVFTFFILIAVFFIIFAGWKYLTAGGEEEKIKDANRMLIYAVVAIVIAILARSVPAIIANFLNVGNVAGCA